jgi:hypothetical protein
MTIPRGACRLAPAAFLDDSCWPARIEGKMALIDPHEDCAPFWLLELPLPWAMLTTATTRIGVVASPAPGRQHGPWYVALAPEAPFELLLDAWERAPEVLVESPRPDGEGWRDAAWRLEAHPWCKLGTRDWAWAWNRGSYGPVSLELWLDADAAALMAHLDAMGALPYRPSGPGELRSFSDDVRDERLLIADGHLTFLRSYHEPPEHIAAFDAGLLDALAGGLMGPLAWDVIDGDYGNYLATGEDGRALAEYLDPAVPAEPLVRAWAEVFRPRVVDAVAATTLEEVFGAVARAFALGDASSVDELARLLASAPGAALPRAIELHVARTLCANDGTTWLLALARARTRTRLTLRWV